MKVGWLSSPADLAESSSSSGEQYELQNVNSPFFPLFLPPPPVHLPFILSPFPFPHPSSSSLSMLFIGKTSAGFAVIRRRLGGLY